MKYSHLVSKVTTSSRDKFFNGTESEVPLPYSKRKRVYQLVQSLVVLLETKIVWMKRPYAFIIMHVNIKLKRQ